MHYGARYYSPGLGRWISADTVVPEPGNPQALNRYAYVYNNPLRYTDPSGHKLDPGDDYDRPLPPPPPPPLLPYDITAFELGWLWLTEQCPEYTVLNKNYELTQYLMYDEGVNQARAQFYRKLREGTLTKGTDDYGYKYLVIPYVREAVEYAVGYDRIGFFTGSYHVHTRLNAADRTVTFTVKDSKNLESGTRSPFYYGPDFIGPIVNPYLPESLDLHRSAHSLEGLIMGHEQLDLPSDIFLASILRDRGRSDPGLFGSDIRLGGHIDLIFTWTEPLQVDQGK